MKNLYLRILSGIVYIALIVGATYCGMPAIFLAVICFLGVICLKEFLLITTLKNKSFYYLILGFLLVATHLFYQNVRYFVYAFLSITLITQCLLILSLYQKEDVPKRFVTHKPLLSIFYLTGGLLFISLLPFSANPEIFSPKILFNCFILIWVNDSLAFAFGKYLGKHKLFERVSPKKTIEGFIGGLISCVLTGYYFLPCHDIPISKTQWVVIAFIVGISGTLGDLVQSKFKRIAGVKDSGTIMPGHGGIYDRLDSILFVCPFVFIYIIFIQYYVS